MNNSLIFYFCLLSFLISICCTKNPNLDSHKINEGYNLKYNISNIDFGKTSVKNSVSTKLIKLELTTNSIIDQVSKFEIYGDYFIVLSQGQNKDVLLFNRHNGEFLFSFKFNHPHLIVNPTDFSLFNDKIYINDYELMHLAIFDLSNPNSVYFNKIIESKFKFDKFCVVDKDNIVVYPYMASLNSWENYYLNFDLLLLNRNLEPIDFYLQYDIEKYHYGSNYRSTNKINFIRPFFRYDDNTVYYSDLLRDTTYLLNIDNREIKPFAYHAENESAKSISLNKDLQSSISIMEKSDDHFGSQLFYMGTNSFVFSSVYGKKAAYIYYNHLDEEYKMFNCVDYSTTLNFDDFPLGLPILKIDEELNVYSMVVPHLYSEGDLKSKGLSNSDNPVIVVYNTLDVLER